MEGSSRPRRQLTGRDYRVPEEEPLEWEEEDSDDVRSGGEPERAFPGFGDYDDNDLESLSDSDTPSNDSEDDDEETGKGTNDQSFLASIHDKLTRWGAFKKDWIGMTDLERYLRAEPQKGIKHLKRLVGSLRQGASIEDFEKQIPPAEITNFYWSAKNDLERLKGQKVMLVIGFCPQYEITLDGNAAEIAPGESECLTQLIVSWLARQSDGLLLAWDFRHDCRKKNKPVHGGTAYAKCAPIDKLKTETEQLNYLSYILLLVAEKLYSIDIQGTISFSACTNQFVRVLDVPHITLPEHISRIRKNPMLAVNLVRGMRNSGLYGDQQEEELYKSLSKFLSLGPGRESGRRLVNLPPLDQLGQKSAAPISFEELMSLVTTERKEYGRTASIKSRRKTKEREANDPVYAEKRKKAVKGYKDKEYGKVKKMRVEDPKAYRILRDKMSENQRNWRAKKPGYSAANNNKVAQKRLDDPEFDQMFRERKKRIDKKCKDKIRAKKADAAGAANVIDIEANKAGVAHALANGSPKSPKELPTRERAASKTQSSSHTRKSSKSVK
ncbi:hypothetical protein ONS95_005626 [Cadophora gregata]|uniref:uncharacterized protein n=1 Tax=Cadophora gregata TaxID=51156 RepID=UPI0026DD033E|nr:uncharacterized protein ONS95_005626 [Cadophora gregata]KAK0103614.1 hypothetical protein ONS95_005626 [Cadophora gregata]KAK0107806.1 hypothetical protein ONS96_003598 [Cadophora gregata f. sp. sojae]